MNLKFSLLVSGAIALGLTILPVATVKAQSAPTATESSKLDLDLKLTPQQRRAFAMIGEFALDQMENILTNGFNSDKLDRAETQRQAESIRQTLSTLRLDDQQKAVLQTILQTAREQMRRQMGDQK